MAENTREVLIVDDERTMIDMLSIVLEGEGFEIIVATNGEEAVSLLKEYQPAVAIVDKNLPDFSGLEVIRQSQVGCPDTEFILITGYPSKESKLESDALGLYAYLTKPFESLELLIAHVRAAHLRSGGAN